MFVFYLSSQVGEPYRIDVFLAERFYCDSVFLFQSSGVQFVRPWDATLPLDYVVDISENLHIGGLLQELDVADAFSSGPYTVQILNGNDQRRFDIVDGSKPVPSPPVTPAQPSFDLDGETVFLCPNVSNYTTKPIVTVSPGIGFCVS